VVEVGYTYESSRELCGVVETVLRKLFYVPSALAASSEGLHLMEQFSAEVTKIQVGWSNWLLSIMLAIVAFFLKKVLDRIDKIHEKVWKVDRRLIVLEMNHNTCWYQLDINRREGGRRVVDASRFRSNEEED